MDSDVIAAVVAGVVSLIVGAATAVVTLVKTNIDLSRNEQLQRLQQQSERDQQKAQFESERDRQRDQFQAERERQQAEFEAAFNRQQAEFVTERSRQSAELRRRMTERLYERRLSAYPGLFLATAKFRRSVLAAASDLRAHLRVSLDTVDEWHANDGGLLLSPEAHERMMDLRREVRWITEDKLTQDQHSDAIYRVWMCKNRLRSALREDIFLLFEESEQRKP